MRLGPYDLSHRVVLAPMTRLRSEPDDSASAMMVEYYRRGGDERGYIDYPAFQQQAAA
jgi:N-ethylmaleimide reductase